MKTFAVFQLVNNIELEVTWVAANDESHALILTGHYGKSDFIAREV